ncbi:sugar transferase [Ruegeria arenilitoris]|uniref:sugar transferase n=1 Tax=Ruegeria arenilitoris TaxID=1173585 RepID=UPI001481B823|nr:sugar transferase [Ruegeria arenilitoris]
MNHNRGSFPLEETDIYNTNQHFISKSDDRANLEGFYTLKGKRLLDILLVLIGAPFVLPLMLLVAICVRLDGGPAIYKQKRVGIGGREFDFLKFRSMMIDADQLFQDHLRDCPAAAAEWQARQKLENDPRVTKIGRFLRVSSLDELPQLWNVLVGDMSLVGPRPMLPQQQALYPGLDYHLMKPGITGLWQVSERNDVEFSHRAVFDSEYARRIGLWLDLKILFQTIGAVCNGTGR